MADPLNNTPQRNELLVQLEFLEDCRNDCSILLRKWKMTLPEGNSTSPHAVAAMLALEAALRRQIRALYNQLGEDLVPWY